MLRLAWWMNAAHERLTSMEMSHRFSAYGISLHGDIHIPFTETGPSLGAGSLMKYSDLTLQRHRLILARTVPVGVSGPIFTEIIKSTAFPKYGKAKTVIA